MKDRDAIKHLCMSWLANKLVTSNINEKGTRINAMLWFVGRQFIGDWGRFFQNLFAQFLVKCGPSNESGFHKNYLNFS